MPDPAPQEVKTNWMSLTGGGQSDAVAGHQLPYVKGVTIGTLWVHQRILKKD